MALDVWVANDILRVLRALHVSSEVPAALALDMLQDDDLLTGVERPGRPQDHELRAAGATLNEERVLSYQKGFRTALASVALAFGLVPVSSAAPTASSHSVSQRYELDLRSFVESMVRSEP